MTLIADGLLIGGALAAAFYCWVLSIRVNGLKDLDKGLGGAIASLSRQVNEMQNTLKEAKAFNKDSQVELQELAERAERASDNLRLMLATVHKEQRNAKKAAKVEPFPQPDITQSVVEEIAQFEQPPEYEDEKSSVTLAQKLQQDIREKISGRDRNPDQESNSDRDDFVKALQNILAASK